MPKSAKYPALFFLAPSYLESPKYSLHFLRARFVVFQVVCFICPRSGLFMFHFFPNRKKTGRRGCMVWPQTPGVCVGHSRVVGTTLLCRIVCTGTFFLYMHAHNLHTCTPAFTRTYLRFLTDTIYRVLCGCGVYNAVG